MNRLITSFNVFQIFEFMVVFVPIDTELECTGLKYKLAREHSVQNENDSFSLDYVLTYSSSVLYIEVKLNCIKTEGVKAKIKKLKLKSLYMVNSDWLSNYINQ